MGVVACTVSAGRRKNRCQRVLPLHLAALLPHYGRAAGTPLPLPAAGLDHLLSPPRANTAWTGPWAHKHLSLTFRFARRSRRSLYSYPSRYTYTHTHTHAMHTQIEGSSVSVAACRRRCDAEQRARTPLTAKHRHAWGIILCVTVLHHVEVVDACTGGWASTEQDRLCHVKVDAHWVLRDLW